MEPAERATGPFVRPGLSVRRIRGLLPTLRTRHGPIARGRDGAQRPARRLRAPHHMITGYFANEIRRLNRNLARLGLLLFALAALWAVALERPYWRRLVSPSGEDSGARHPGKPAPR